MKYIVVCKCSGMREKAQSAFKIAFPMQDIPPAVVGKSAIISLAEKNPGTNFYRYLLAISKSRGKFAYYIEENNGDVAYNYDLLKGKRLG